MNVYGASTAIWPSPLANVFMAVAFTIFVVAIGFSLRAILRGAALGSQERREFEQGIRHEQAARKAEVARRREAAAAWTAPAPLEPQFLAIPAERHALASGNKDTLMLIARDPEFADALDSARRTLGEAKLKTALQQLARRRVDEDDE